MGELVNGDDGLPAEEVGQWALTKHKLLCDYVQISSATRRKFIGPGKAGSAYIDLFCGPGRCQIRETNEYSDGGCVAAWKQSVAGGAPFSQMIIGDTDSLRLDAAVTRLRQLHAPVTKLIGPASECARDAYEVAPRLGLNFAFLDPYKLEALSFGIIEILSQLQRMDFLVHISTMDLQRNFDRYAAMTPSPFDAFAPGWREAVNLEATQGRGRKDVFDYWRDLVSRTGATPSEDVRLISGTQGQRLYWLLLAARHELAQRFWIAINKANDQPSFEF